MNPQKNLAARIGGWSVRHRWTALGLWFAFVIIAVVGGAMAGEIDLKTSQTGNGESGHASQVIDKAGFKESANEMVLITSPATTVKSDGFGATIDDVVTTLEKDKQVQKVVDPREPGVDGKIADGGHAALVTFEVKGDETQADTNVVPVMDSVKALSAEHPGFTVEQFGEASAAHVLNDKIGKDFEHARTVSLPLTLIILLFAFGAMVAAGVPLVLAFSAVLATFGLNSLFSHVMPSTAISAEIILMIGMAVGVDYSLFYLRRERDERAATKPYDRAAIKQAKAAVKAAKKAGDDVAVQAAQAELKAAKATSRTNRERALEVAASTSGQAVLISGITVFIAMSGMLLAGDPTFMTLGISAMIVVLVALIGSLTGLPAILSVLGDRVERGRVPLVGRITKSRDGESRFWGAIVDRVLARPAVSVIVAGSFLVLAALPALALKTETPSVAFLPQDPGHRPDLQPGAEGLPGGPDPAVVVVKADNVSSPQAQFEIGQLKSQALATGQMNNPMDVTVNPDHTVAVVSIPLTGDGRDAPQQALKTLRDKVVPATVGQLRGADVGVTGGTAASVDFNDLMGVRTPVVFAFVLRTGVHPDADHVPLDRDPDQGHPAEPAVDRRCLRHPRGDLPARHRRVGDRIPLDRDDRELATTLPVRGAVRPLDGLSRLHPEQGEGSWWTAGCRPRTPCRRASRRRRSCSAAVVMVGVFALFGTLSVLDVKQFGGRCGDRGADRRDHHPWRAPARLDEAAGDWNWYMPSWLSWVPTLQHSLGPGSRRKPDPVPGGQDPWHM